MNVANLTIEDYLKMNSEGVFVVINDGNVIGFQNEIPVKTGNQDGD